MKALKSFGLAFAALCCLPGYAADNPIDVWFQPIFMGPTNGLQGVDTVQAILLDNALGPADVRLEIDSDGSKTIYSVSLKPGLLSKLTVFIPSSNPQRPSYDLSAKIRRNSSVVDYHANEPLLGYDRFYGTTTQVLKLSSKRASVSLDRNSGQSYGASGGFIQMSNTGNQVVPYLGYASEAPSRPIAYRRFRCVMLGQGCEELSDGAVLALKEYVLGGGSLLMNVPATDKRWQGFIPTEHGVLQEGFGKVFLLQHPKTPVRSNSAPDVDDLKIALDQTAVNRVDPEAPGNQLIGVYGPTTTDSAADPFATTLPSFGKILGLLAAYFLAVVPINFLILKRLRRPELTWVTAPLLAMVFAGVLFRGTKSLYQASISSSTHGTLFLQQSVDEGIFEGESDLFFPHAGSVALGLQNVDAIGTWLDDPNSYYGSNSRTTAPLVVDNGTLSIPNYHSSNLAFKQLKLSARVAAQGWIVFRKGAIRAGVTPIYVENRSPYPISNATLYDGVLSAHVGDLAPGASAEMDTVPAPRLSPQSSNSMANQPDEIIGKLQGDGRVFLLGTMNDLPVGPQIGKRIESRTNIAVVAFPPADLDLKP